MAVVYHVSYIKNVTPYTVYPVPNFKTKAIVQQKNSHVMFTGSAERADK